MNDKFFNVVVIRTENTTDADYCPTTEDNEIYNNTFVSKIEAIRQAQKRHSKQPLNGYVCAVWAAVYPVTITAKGTTRGPRVYNLYKCY